MSCILVPDYRGLLNIENWEISSSEILISRTVRLILPLYIRLISDSLFDLRASDLSVLPVISDVKRPLEFSERSANLVTETFAEPAANW